MRSLLMSWMRPMTTAPTTLAAEVGHERIARWRRDWEEVMSRYLPAITSCEESILTVAENAVAPHPRRVLDLGGGPGVFASRMVRRWPDAEVAMVIDPVLLTLARGVVPDGVRLYEADLSTPAWTDCIGDNYDLVTAIMTVHYLRPEQVHALYRQALRVMAPGGLLVVMDVMPEDEVPTVMDALGDAVDEAAADLAWVRWWTEISATPACGTAVRDRISIFDSRPAADFTASLSWHAAGARAAGFAEAGTVWRTGRHAALAAVAPRAR